MPIQEELANNVAELQGASFDSVVSSSTMNGPIAKVVADLTPRRFVSLRIKLRDCKQLSVEVSG
jgi:hypothetical protein